MALSFLKSTTVETVEALVFADGFPEFGALAEDLDAEFGKGHWQEVRTAEAASVLKSDATTAHFAVIAVSDDVPEVIQDVADLIKRARGAGLLVLLVVGELSSRSMHRLMREGISEFLPYPDEENTLAEAVNRLRLARNTPNLPLGPGIVPVPRRGMVLTTYGAAGGVGASTFAVNLAWEITQATFKMGRRVALLDFNFQYGSIATYLDVPRREAVYELVSEAANLDQTGLTQALTTYKDRLHVLTAPRDALPLDIVSPSDVSAIISLARETFDYVVIDMPQSLMNWSEQVYTASDIFYAMMEVDMRSAQNMFRFLRTLKAEEMPLEKIKFVLNRGPGYTDLSGKARVRRVAESLGLEYAIQLPDGGRQVVAACDQGAPLAEAARSNGLRKEIAKVAKAIVAMNPARASISA